MSADIDRGENSYAESTAFSLMRELQYTLYKIARSAELGDPVVLADIQKEADIALRLVDSYMATSSLESGQTELELTTVGLGSLLHETAYEVRSASSSEVEVQPKAPQPVMTHNLLLKNFLFSVGYFISKTCDSQLNFCSFKSKDGIGVGVVSKNFDISTDELRRALAGTKMHMPMAKHTNQSAIMLVLADAIARALGSKLAVKKLGRSKGFCVILPKSEQLALV